MPSLIELANTYNHTLDRGDGEQEHLEAIAERLLHSALSLDMADLAANDWKRIASFQAAQSLARRIQHVSSQPVSAEVLDRKLASAVDSAPNLLFYAPAAVERLYDPNADPDDAVIIQGVDAHCRLIRHAVNQVANRHAGSIERADLDREAVKDELYGAALEEIVKTLSDSNARVWRAGQDPILLPPEGARGWKQNVVVRVAIDQNAQKAALLHSNQVISIWRLPDQTKIGRFTLPRLGSGSDSGEWYAPFFSKDGTRLIQPINQATAALVDLSQEHPILNTLPADELKIALKPANNHDEQTLPEMSVRTRKGETLSINEYRNHTNHCASTPDNSTAITASETLRFMPPWMCDIGFENAVFYILKRRLIDRIRKQIHVESTQTTDEEHVDESFSPSNSIGIYQYTKPLEDMSPSESLDHAGQLNDDWQDQHDLERILAVLQTITITYKNKRIACDELARLKAEGKTNTEIGEAIGAPRGTIDYLWSQCREQIRMIFGDEL